MKPLIEVQNISKSYRMGERGFRSLRDSFHFWWKETLRKNENRAERQLFQNFWALKDVSFEIKAGEAVGVLGRNGA